MIARHRQIHAIFKRMTKALTRRSRLARAKGEEVTGDEVIAALAAANCPVADGPPVTVAEVIGEDAAYYDLAPVLEAQGVVLTAGRRGRRGSFRAGKTRVFVDPEAVKGHLLKDAPWSTHDVARALLGVPGADRWQRSVNGRRRRGIEVPLAAWVRATQGKAVPRDL
jgi:hypothetical protein